MSSRRTQEMYNTESQSSVQPSQPLGQNETYASADGVATSTQGLPPSCSRAPVADPAELLPKDTNSQWAQLNPTGSGDLQEVNLLRSGYHMGIDTVLFHLLKYSNIPVVNLIPTTRTDLAMLSEDYRNLPELPVNYLKNKL